MSSAEKRMPMTLAEYLEWEPLQTEKHEFWEGKFSRKPVERVGTA